MSIRFNFTTDHHFSHKPPGRRQGDYFMDLSSKMAQVITHCNSTGSIPLFGGDLFHLKDPSKIVTPNLIRFLGGMSNLLGQFFTPPICAIGNHDIRSDRLSTLPEQGLGLLAAAGKVKLLANYSEDLLNWAAPSGHAYQVHRVLPGVVYPTGCGSYIYVYSTPYMDDPQDLVAYLGSEIFHTALASCVGEGLPVVGNKSVTGVLLLHTLSGPVGGEFYGLMRASYQDIHTALSYSALGRATSAVLFGHEHPEMGDYILPLDQSPLLVNNLPPNCWMATQGTIYINPASFARSALDFDDSNDRPVYMTELTYTPSELYLGLEVHKIPLITRPLDQLFGGIGEDPLNQNGDSEEVPLVIPMAAYTWTNFSDALAQIDQVGNDPHEFILQRLQSEPLEVAATVNALLPAVNSL